MDSDLKPSAKTVIEASVVETNENSVVSADVSHVAIVIAEDVVMNCDSNEVQESMATTEHKNSFPADESTTEDMADNSEDEAKQEEQLENILMRNEEILANDVMNLDVNKGFLINNNEETNPESQEVIESQNSSTNDTNRQLADEDMSSDNQNNRNELTGNLKIKTDDNESNEQTVPTLLDDDITDSDLRIAGLKTSLMLSEEKNQKCEQQKKELEEELKKVYTHLFKCLDEKKTLQKKCETLEEQLDKLMATSGQKRPAQESPGSSAKPTPPKKATNLKRNNEMQNNFNNNNNQRNRNQKSVRFQEQRPFFGRFGARYQEPDMTPPPFPGPFAPAFIPPPIAQRGPPMPPMGQPFRGPPVMSSADMSDLVLTDGYQLISNIGNRLHLTATIVDRAVRLFRQCYDSPLRAMCRTQNQSTATACVYIACREEHCPQSFKALCSVSKIDFKILSQCCKYIVNALGLCLDQMTPEDAISEFCGRSGFSPVIQRAALQIVRKAINMKLLPVKSPLTAAAAAIFMASMASEDQRPVFEISSLTGVGDTTIRNSYNRMLSYARQLFPMNFPFYTPPEHLPHV